MAIGNWGTDVVFSVSDFRVLTTKDVNQTVGSEWATHSRIGEKDVSGWKRRHGKFQCTPYDFIPPTVDEVQTYCQERHSSVDPVAFVSFYESKGWMVGKNQMKNWRSAISSWERRDKSSQTDQPPAIPRMSYHTEIINGEEVDVADGP